MVMNTGEIREHNIELGVLSPAERERFDNISLADYVQDRKRRRLPELTTWQHAQLTLERIEAAVFDL